MTDVADNSVALVVTSPPYFAGKAYEEALGQGHVPATYLDYLQQLREVFAECVRVLEPGGRIAVNVANLGRRPYRSLSADVTTILQDDLRLLMRGEVLWVKQRGAAGNCAWGSFQRPGQPGAARPQRAGDHRLEGSLRSGDFRQAARQAGPAFDQHDELATSSWKRPSMSGRSRRSAPAASITRRRSLLRCPSG